MVLDYVLGHHERAWYATERDKVALFTARFAVPVGELPYRIYTARDGLAAPTIRYFVHKLPIYLQGEPPVVHFVHLVVDDTGRAFEQFLIDHARLFARLPAWAVDAIGAGAVDVLSACQQVFTSFVADRARPTPTDLMDVQWFFKTRRLVEAGQLGGLSVADINRFRDGRANFSAPAIARLYARWLREGERAFAGPTADGSSPAARVGQLVMEQVPGQYTQIRRAVGGRLRGRQVRSTMAPLSARVSAGLSAPTTSCVFECPQHTQPIEQATHSSSRRGRWATSVGRRLGPSVGAERGSRARGERPPRFRGALTRASRRGPAPLGSLPPRLSPRIGSRDGTARDPFVIASRSRRCRAADESRITCRSLCRAPIGSRPCVTSAGSRSRTAMRSCATHASSVTPPPTSSINSSRP